MVIASMSFCICKELSHSALPKERTTYMRNAILLALPTRKKAVAATRAGSLAAFEATSTTVVSAALERTTCATLCTASWMSGDPNLIEDAFAV